MACPTDGSKVSRSPYTQLVYDCLRSRWSCVAVYRYLCREYGPGEDHRLSTGELWDRYEIPSLRSIQRYAERWVPDADRLPATIIEKILAGVEPRVDHLGELAQSVALSKLHLAKAAETEDKLPVPLDALERAIEAHGKAVERHLDVAFKLGVIKSADQPRIPIHITTGKEDGEREPTLRDVLVAFGKLPPIDLHQDADGLWKSSEDEAT